jgi:hypothetical protein
MRPLVFIFQANDMSFRAEKIVWCFARAPQYFISPKRRIDGLHGLQGHGHDDVDAST